MGETKRISRILIAEPNLLFRRGLTSLFGSDPSVKVIGEASSSRDVLSQLRNVGPDVLVIDAGMLGGSGDQHFGLAIRQIRPSLLILVLSERDDEQSMTTAIGCGAKGFVLKNAPASLILSALQRVAFEDGVMNVSGLLPEFQALASRTPDTNNTSVLTAREQEVIKLLAEGKTVRIVANDLCLSMKTIEAHKLNLMRKLDIHDRASLVAYANRNGLVASTSHAG